MKAQIEADRQARRQAEAERKGEAVKAPNPPAAAAAAVAAPAEPAEKKEYDITRIQVREIFPVHVFTAKKSCDIQRSRPERTFFFF